MAVIDANTVKYYFDGKFIGKLDVTGYTTSLNYIRFETNNGRTSVAYIDDVMIRDYYVEKGRISGRDRSFDVTVQYGQHYKSFLCLQLDNGFSVRRRVEIFPRCRLC